jgi:hypothetical protein
MKKKPPDQDVINRLLLARNLLDKIRDLPMANPDRYIVASHVMTAHDAAELAISGIAAHIKVTPRSPKTYLMDYFELIDKDPKNDVQGKGYFSQLNTARNGIKHTGVFPDPKQWFRVGEKTYGYVSDWCKKYLNVSFEELDESDMISDSEAKKLYDAAKEALNRSDFKEVLEQLARALYSVFENNKALRGLHVGIPRAEDALKLSAFGVHTNDFLALQELLPEARYAGVSLQVKIFWEQGKFGHPANWRENVAQFCLKTFVDVVLRIQDAKWIPGAIDFEMVYEHKITALVDDVEIVQKNNHSMFLDQKDNVVRTLKKGESIRGKITKEDTASWVATLQGKKHKPVYSFMNLEKGIWGEIEQEKISIRCVPIDNEFVRDFFPDLPELDYE